MFAGAGIKLYKLFNTLLSVSVSRDGTLRKHMNAHQMLCFEFPSSRASCRSVICLARLDGIREPLTALIAITTHSKPAS